MVEGDSKQNSSNCKYCPETRSDSFWTLGIIWTLFFSAYNVESGQQPNYNTSNSTVDNRSIIQPYGLGSDSKDLGYHINEAYDVDKNDLEKAGGGRSGGMKAGFEQAIEMCGYGKFHYILLGICGLVSTSEEMDVISMSFILPSAQCDLNLNTETKGWLNSIIFIGMMVGAYFWGSIADSMGRKKVLIVISFMNGICIVASSFSQTYEWFMLFRFLNGAA